MGLLFIFLTVLFTVVGQLLVKQGMVDITRHSLPSATMLTLVFQAFLNIKVVTGLACAVVAALAWIVAVSKTDLSFAYPFMGLAIALVLSLSPILLGETVPMKRWIGVIIVCGGLWLAAQK